MSKFKPQDSADHDAGDRYMDAIESLDPALCETHGHTLATTVECIRCGEAFYPTETEGTT